MSEVVTQYVIHSSSTTPWSLSQSSMLHYSKHCRSKMAEIGYKFCMVPDVVMLMGVLTTLGSFHLLSSQIQQSFQVRISIFWTVNCQIHDFVMPVFCKQCVGDGVSCTIPRLQLQVSWTSSIHSLNLFLTTKLQGQFLSDEEAFWAVFS